MSASEDEDFVEGIPRGAIGVLREAACLPDLDPSGSNRILPLPPRAMLPGGASPPTTLLRHPDRPILTPRVQRPPAFTEDRLAERRAAIEGLLASSPAGIVQGVEVWNVC